MFILLETNFEVETTKVLATDGGEFAEEMLSILMEETAENYRINRIVNDAHYSDNESKSFFKSRGTSIHCKADCGDNIKWQIIEC